MSFFAKFQSWIIAAGVAIVSAIWFFLAGRSAGKSAEQVKSTQKARKTEQKATDALLTGLKHEEDAVTAARRRRYERLRDGDKPEAPPTPLDS